jgi:hypothetical protein
MSTTASSPPLPLCWYPTPPLSLLDFDVESVGDLIEATAMWIEDESGDPLRPETDDALAEWLHDHQWFAPVVNELGSLDDEAREQGIDELLSMPPPQSGWCVGPPLGVVRAGFDDLPTDGSPCEEFSLADPPGVTHDGVLIGWGVAATRTDRTAVAYGRHTWQADASGWRYRERHTETLRLAHSTEWQQPQSMIRVVLRTAAKIRAKRRKDMTVSQAGGLYVRVMLALLAPTTRVEAITAPETAEHDQFERGPHHNAAFWSSAPLTQLVATALLALSWSAKHDLKLVLPEVWGEHPLAVGFAQREACDQATVLARILDDRLAERWREVGCRSITLKANAPGIGGAEVGALLDRLAQGGTFCVEDDGDHVDPWTELRGAFKASSNAAKFMGSRGFCTLVKTRWMP